MMLGQVRLSANSSAISISGKTTRSTPSFLQDLAVVFGYAFDEDPPSAEFLGVQRREQGFGDVLAHADQHRVRRVQRQLLKRVVVRRVADDRRVEVVLQLFDGFLRRIDARHAAAVGAELLGQCRAEGTKPQDDKLLLFSHSATCKD